MTDDILKTLPARRGHFLLESGYHTSVWITLDALFVDGQRIAPLVDALAARLRPHGASAVCGPFTGGAFLALLLGRAMNARFFYTQPAATRETGLFSATYALTPELQRRMAGERVAVVDEMISAGSSVRATIAAVAAAGAAITVVGALVVLGDAAVNHFASVGVPLEALEHRTFPLWTPDECPLCASGEPLETP